MLRFVSFELAFFFSSFNNWINFRSFIWFWLVWFWYSQLAVKMFADAATYEGCNPSSTVKLSHSDTALNTELTWPENVTMLKRESLNAAFLSSVWISSRFTEPRTVLALSELSTANVTPRLLSPRSSGISMASLTSDPMVVIICTAVRSENHSFLIVLLTFIPPGIIQQLKTRGWGSCLSKLTHKHGFSVYFISWV